MFKKKKIPINILGAKLKGEREKQGLSQEEIANRLAERKVTAKTIDNWEKGFGLPDENNLNKLIDLYNLDINEIIKMKETLDYGRQQEKYIHRKKFVGRTLWDIFGNFIIKLVKIGILIGLVYLLIRFDLWNKIKEVGEEKRNIQQENYIVDDEYLRMLNSKNGQKIKTRDNNEN